MKYTTTTTTTTSTTTTTTTNNNNNLFKMDKKRAQKHGTRKLVAMPKAVDSKDDMD